MTDVNEDGQVPIHTDYEDSACPDCGEPIPHSKTDGESCENCGHVFTAPHPDDDAQPGDDD